MRRDKMGHLFSIEYENITKRAESLGWIISCDDIWKGITFRKNNFILWNSVNSRVIVWHVAEVFRDKLISHTEYSTAYEAIYNPCVSDPTKGLGVHGMVPNEHITWNTKELIGEEWKDVEKSGVVICAHGLHNSFITVCDDSGVETYLLASQLHKNR